MGEISFIIYGAKTATDLAETLERTGHARVLARVRDPEGLVAAAQSGPDALLLDLNEEDPHRVLDVVESLPAPRPVLLISGPAHDSQLLLRSVRLGVREYFDRTPDLDVLGATLRSLVSQPVAHEPRRARKIAVVGSKGGVGATTVACQLSALLQSSSPAALVDLDLTCGAADLYLDLQPGYCISHLRGSPQELDSTFMSTLLARHPSGVSLLASPRHLEDAEQVRAADVQRALEVLAGDFGWVVVDAPRGWDDALVRLLDHSDLILLVTARQVPALHQTRRQLELCRALGLADRVRLVVGRASADDPVTEADLERFLERGSDAVLPDEPTTAGLAADQGKTVGEIAARSELAVAYRELSRSVHGWCGVPFPADADSTSRGLLGALRSRIRRA